MSNETNHAEQQARAQLASIRAMVAALTVDYDRLQDLRDMEDDTLSAEWCIAERDALAEAAGECADEEDARRAIEDDHLSIEVRSGWASVGEELTAEEFRIVLCTGGPHVEIVGDLDQWRQPVRARLLYQDWGTPKTELVTVGEDAADLLTYCSVHYFGE